MTFTIRSRSGNIIRTVAEWFSAAPPAGGSKQWKEGRSALELARRWVSGELPCEVAALLLSHPATAGFVAEEAFAECQTSLDDFRGGKRNHDLVVVGQAIGRTTVLCIEGKADEPFDATLSQRVARVAKKPGSKVAERVRLLAEGVLRNTDLGVIGHLRYQLLQATAATLIEAQVRGANQAVLVVHEFRSSGLNLRKLEKNALDFAAFARCLCPKGESVASPVGLGGPIRVPGGRHIPTGIDLFIGKAVFTGELVPGTPPPDCDV